MKEVSQLIGIWLKYDKYIPPYISSLVTPRYIILTENGDLFEGKFNGKEFIVNNTDSSIKYWIRLPNIKYENN